MRLLVETLGRTSNVFKHRKRKQKLLKGKFIRYTPNLIGHRKVWYFRGIKIGTMTPSFQVVLSVLLILTYVA